MTDAEDQERGVLTINVNYIEFAQALNNLMYMGQKLKDKLEIAAIEKNMTQRERRKCDRGRRKDDS